MPGKLTTHALDIHQGRPAGHLSLQLFHLGDDGSRALLKTVATNADGRTDAPLLGPDEMMIGRYELVFAVGAYFLKAGIPLSTPPFLDDVPVRFSIADSSSACHVPLLFSPWAYSTYRGS
jgi:5-hydroxyisourate hydrolase